MPSADPPVAPVLMYCARRDMRLTAAGCARLFRSTLDDRPEAYEGRFACLNCPIGAANAGVAISPVAGAVEQWRMVCPRCRELASRIISGRLCVSCYNREREVVRGRDGKGNRPHLADRLQPASVTVIEDGQARTVGGERVLGRVELMVLTAKGAQGALAFCRPPMGPPPEAEAAA